MKNIIVKAGWGGEKFLLAALLRQDAPVKRISILTREISGNSGVICCK
jgi:hypothetical protein